MQNLLYVIAAVCIIGWIIGSFLFAAGTLIHLLLVLAVIAVLIGLIRRADTE